jgi:DNA primase
VAIPQDFIQELLARTDVVEVVGRHVQLKKGGANYMGLCPFHAEKSPSFTVSPTKQFFHCFGCGKNGNAIGFLMEHAGMNFVEAVKDLAQTYGMQVPEEEADPAERQRAAQRREQQATITDVLEQAAGAYRQHLRKAPQAIDYLKGRGLSGDIAKRFGLGYAPEGWRALASVFPDYQAQVLVDSGLVIHQHEEGQEDKRYDRFRDRIMFPIRNVKGECIGFGGRVMGQGTPKYLNSPETPVFSKGRELYGLYEARQAIRDAGYVLVTEGYMDVVALAQLGFAQAVATLGTACTTDHVQKLFRVTDAVVFSFDGDAAGRRAARKALDGALPYATDVRSIRFLFLPDPHDPDSFVREFGADAFARSVHDATPLSRFLIDTAREGCDLATAEGRALLASQAKPLWTALPEGVLKTQLLNELADLVQIGAHELQRLWVAERPGSSSGGSTGVGTSSGQATGKYPSGPFKSRWKEASGNAYRRPTAPSPGLRRQAAPRQDRAVQLLFSAMASWDVLSPPQHALLCALPAPHGDAFAWLDHQLHEHGIQPWAALREALRGHELEAWLSGLVEQAPAELEHDSGELASILHEMEKADLSAQLSEMAPHVASDPALYERFKVLSARYAQLKSTPSGIIQPS